MSITLVRKNNRVVSFRLEEPISQVSFKTCDYMFFRIIKGYEEADPMIESEECIRMSICAWKKNATSCIERLKKGKVVSTPYAYFVAIPIRSGKI